MLYLLVILFSITKCYFYLLAFSGSVTHDKGCWIGLQDPLGLGEFDWIQQQAVGGTERMFLDWRRQEPNNHSISESFSALGGERCATLVPWQEDPLLLEQGSWNDDSCAMQKPFICQLFGNTQRYTLSVTTDTVLQGGVLEGGVLQTGTGKSDFYKFTATRSASLIVGTNPSECILGNVILTDGSSLVLNAVSVKTQSDAFIGEPMSPLNTAVPMNGPAYFISGLQMQPYVIVSAGSNVNFSPLCTASSPAGCSVTGSNVTINARMFVNGGITVGLNAEVFMLQVFILHWLNIHIL